MLCLLQYQEFLHDMRLNWANFTNFSFVYVARSRVAAAAAAASHYTQLLGLQL